MDLPRRKKLSHEVPLWIDLQKETYFLTVNCQPKGTNHLAKPDVAGPLLDSVRFRNEKFIWFAHLFLIMPDHVHALISFPPSERTLRKTVTLWKRWTARELGIEWQRDFFEHRLRSDESRREKADYILANPVRKGLVKGLKEWPYVFIPKAR
jgi:REP element-mobilizing transposase RayT